MSLWKLYMKSRIINKYKFWKEHNLILKWISKIIHWQFRMQNKIYFDDTNILGNDQNNFINYNNERIE